MSEEQPVITIDDKPYKKNELDDVVFPTKP